MRVLPGLLKSDRDNPAESHRKGVHLPGIQLAKGSCTASRNYRRHSIFPPHDCQTQEDLRPEYYIKSSNPCHYVMPRARVQ